MKKYQIIFLFFLTIIFWSCGTSGNDKIADNEKNSSLKLENVNALVDYNLNVVEIPVIISAPKGAKIVEGLGNGQLGKVRTINYELVKGDFKLDVNYITGASYYKENLMEIARLSATESEGFDGFVSEEEYGFIYKFKKDKHNDYGFYYLLIKNNQPVEFETGLNYSPYTLEQVKKIYHAAKTAR